MVSTATSISLDLEVLFKEINEQYFEGLLALPIVRWNSRLRTSAGRFIPGRRKGFFQDAPVIEVASYLMEESKSRQLIWDTIAHEMIHYWLWARRKPYGHTKEFLEKMKLMGVSRYNPVPRRRPYRYAYRCPSCFKEFLARRKLGPLACAQCCKRHSDGHFDRRFQLILERAIGC